MNEKELLRQRVRHLIEQGGYVDPATDRHIDRHIHIKRAMRRGVLWLTLATAAFATVQVYFD